MNKKINEYCSKIEKKYGVKSKKKKICPQCGEEGRPTNGNDLVWYHRVGADKSGVVFHRWSYTTGRSVDMIAEDTNVL